MAATASGRHTVFLGMAPGVGKTYQMLEEAHEELRRGRDVVVALLEAHGRTDTIERAKGLEAIPPREINDHGVVLSEVDVDTVIVRRPQLCLVDELAHTNARGSTRAKRFEDVLEILRAGIDVYSTLNVQHLESLAGEVAARAGIRVHETVPDEILESAAEVVLVDITPQLLIERLNAGRIFSGASIAIARSGFFRPERLAALRELSVSWVAHDLSPARTGATTAAAAGEAARAAPAVRAAPSHQRVLALAAPGPSARAILYHGHLAAWRFDAPLEVLWVRDPAKDGGDPEAAAVLQRLATSVGAELLVRPGGDLLETACQTARERRSTYLVVGQPRTLTRLGRPAHRDLVPSLMDALPHVDVQIVALPAVPRR